MSKVNKDIYVNADDLLDMIRNNLPRLSTAADVYKLLDEDIDSMKIGVIIAFGTEIIATEEILKNTRECVYGTCGGVRVMLHDVSNIVVKGERK